MASEGVLPTRLMLICQSATRSMREGGFPRADEPLDAGGLRKAAEARIRLPERARVLTSPALAARQTVEALGLQAQVDANLSDQDFGSWSGRSLEAVGAVASEALTQWIADPASGAPDGEPFTALSERTAAFLADCQGTPDLVVGVTHPMTLRALLAVALGMPPAATFRIDLPPLCEVALSFQGVWRLNGIGRRLGAD